MNPKLLTEKRPEIFLRLLIVHRWRLMVQNRVLAPALELRDPEMVAKCQEIDIERQCGSSITLIQHQPRDWLDFIKN